MKLLYCTRCRDLFLLILTKRTCACGVCSGRYVDTMNAEISGPCLSVAIGNGDFVRAARELWKADQDMDRGAYIHGETQIKYCWLRPNSGPGNPHTKHTAAPTPEQKGEE